VTIRIHHRILVAVALAAMSTILPAQEATPTDSAVNQLQGRREVPRPVQGQTIRIFTPTLPAAERRLSGEFLGVDRRGIGRVVSWPPSWRQSGGDFG
jgi:hypothetical protein